MDYRENWGSYDLSQDRRGQLPELVLKPGMVLEDLESGWVGAAVGLKRSSSHLLVVLEDRNLQRKSFPLGPGFLWEGRRVNLLPPQKPEKKSKPLISASGSVALPQAPARTARASRIWVEGIHDAELIEKVWGHDLRVEGIVVEPLHGADDLAQAVASFCPGPQRKLGILLDHLVEGSKESQLAAQALSLPGAAGNVLIRGHPFIDIWQAIKPSTLGIKAWPTVPRSEDWKTGVLTRLGRPVKGPEDIGASWQQILGRVTTYTDLEPALLGPVEALIDFVTLSDQA